MTVTGLDTGAATQDQIAILDVLRRGGAYTTHEIANLSGLPALTVGRELRSLKDSGEIATASQYQYRFFRLASQSADRESRTVRPVKTRSASDVPRDIRFARSCYGHLAGWLGITFTRSLVDRGILLPRDDVFDVSPVGSEWLDRIGVRLPGRRVAPRRFARPCLDWTERRPHLAGIVGELVLSRFVENGWLKRYETERTLLLTATGEKALGAELGISLT